MEGLVEPGMMEDAVYPVDTIIGKKQKSEAGEHTIRKRRTKIHFTANGAAISFYDN